jgi:hypothetical protein
MAYDIYSLFQGYFRKNNSGIHRYSMCCQIRSIFRMIHKAYGIYSHSQAWYRQDKLHNARYSISHSYNMYGTTRIAHDICNQIPEQIQMDMRYISLRMHDNPVHMLRKPGI